jgi:hypothetical protein
MSRPLLAGDRQETADPVIGGWVVVAPTVEDASVIVVVPAVAGA